MFLCDKSLADIFLGDTMLHSGTGIKVYKLFCVFCHFIDCGIAHLPLCINECLRISRLCGFRKHSPSLIFRYLGLDIPVFVRDYAVLSCVIQVIKKLLIELFPIVNNILRDKCLIGYRKTLAFSFLLGNLF